MKRKRKSQSRAQSLPSSSHPEAEVGVEIIKPAAVRRATSFGKEEGRKAIISISGRDVEDIPSEGRRAA